MREHRIEIVDSYVIIDDIHGYTSIVTCVCGLVSSGSDRDRYGALDIAEQRLKRYHRQPYFRD